MPKQYALPKQKPKVVTYDKEMVEIVKPKVSSEKDIFDMPTQKPKKKVKKKVKGVYNDMLGKIFTKYTGMRTSL